MGADLGGETSVCNIHKGRKILPLPYGVRKLSFQLQWASVPELHVDGRLYGTVVNNNYTFV